MHLAILGGIYLVLALVSGFLIRADVEKQGVYVQGVGPNGWLVACLGTWALAFVFPAMAVMGKATQPWFVFCLLLGLCFSVGVCLTYLLSRGDAMRRSETDAAAHQWPVGK